MVFFVASHSTMTIVQSNRRNHTEGEPPAFRRIAVGVSSPRRTQARPWHRHAKGADSCGTDSQRSLIICLPYRERIQTLRLCHRNRTCVRSLWPNLMTRGASKGKRTAEAETSLLLTPGIAASVRHRKCPYSTLHPRAEPFPNKKQTKKCRCSYSTHQAEA